MKERLICAFLIIPAYISCFFEIKSKKLEFWLRVISIAFLLLLACYLGAVLPQ